MNHADYWKERIRALEKARHDSNGGLVKRLETELDVAFREMDDKISGWYSRIAKNNAVSMAEARRMLSSGELKEFYWTVEEYIKKGRENGIRHNWEKELENASARVHISKLEALKIELRGIAERLGTSEEAQIRRHLAAQYEETYYRTAFELQNGMGVYQSMASIGQKQLETVLSKPWTTDKKTFSDRIWTDKDALIDEVTRQLTRNVLLGKPREDAIRAIAKRFDSSKSNAARLVHTESAFVSAEAARDTYASLNVERFEVDAALDAKTCGICGEMDGKVFDRKDYQTGLTANPFHPNCRCTTVPYVDDDIQRELERKTGRAMRNPETGKTEIADAMTYKEWKEKYVDNSAGNGIMKGTKEKSKMPPLHYIGKIDKEIYSCVTEDIRTDEVIITDERIKHIKERHPSDYERYCEYMKKSVLSPDYIIETTKPYSALVMKSFEHEGKQFKTVVRLVTSHDDERYKNSVITFMKIDEKEWDRLLRNKKILYKSE